MICWDSGGRLKGWRWYGGWVLLRDAFGVWSLNNMFLDPFPKVAEETAGLCLFQDCRLQDVLFGGFDAYQNTWKQKYGRCFHLLFFQPLLAKTIAVDYYLERLQNKYPKRPKRPAMNWRAAFPGKHKKKEKGGARGQRASREQDISYK